MSCFKKFSKFIFCKKISSSTMSEDTLSDIDQIEEYLQLEARIDLKYISIDYLVGISAYPEGVDSLLKHETVIQSVIELTEDKIEEVAMNALFVLVNVSASVNGSIELLKYRPANYNNVLELLISFVLNPLKRDADAACMILSNITRLEGELEVCIDSFLPHLNDILNVFVNIGFNKRGSDLHYLAPMFINLSCSYRIRKWLTEENPHVPFIKLLPFCNYEHSNTRRRGAIGTIRNLSFDVEFHDFLLRNDLDLLTYLLSPIMGNEDYPDDEMDKLPIGLQYLPKEKCREDDVDIRMMILETLNKLCIKRIGRETLRDNGVYYVLREYHKWEMDPKVLLSCENVVDILIQTEEEVGAEDLSTVEVPEELKEKFKRMDENYLSNM